MKSVLLIGLGKFGENIAKKLDDMHHEVLGIDKSEEKVNRCLPYLTDAKISNSDDEAFLKSLDVEKFDVCIVTIRENFEDSLQTTSLLKELGARLVVSCASNEVHEKFLLRNGADHVIYPERQLASWTAICYTSEHIHDYIRLDDNAAIFEVNVPKKWNDKTVGEVNVRKKYSISILAFRKNGTLNMNITPETVFDANDTILVIGSGKDINKCFDI